MKSIIPLSVVLLGAYAGAAMADCSTNPPVTGAALRNITYNSLVCGRPGASYPGGASSPDRWQEEHLFPSGELWDYKLGFASQVDPRKQVGTWSLTAGETKITHSYTGGPSYTWDVRLVSGNTYSYCVGNAEHVRAFVGLPIAANGGQGCQGVFPP